MIIMMRMKFHDYHNEDDFNEDEYHDYEDEDHFHEDENVQGQKQGARLDPKLGAPRKTAGVRFAIW